jgi:hypothetical protein
MTASEAVVASDHPLPVFPPALVPVLRERFAAHGGSLQEVSDAVLVELLTNDLLRRLGTMKASTIRLELSFSGVR